jgi:hypothetical protein
VPPLTLLPTHESTVVVLAPDCRIPSRPKLTARIWVCRVHLDVRTRPTLRLPTVPGLTATRDGA